MVFADPSLKRKRKSTVKSWAGLRNSRKMGCKSCISSRKREARSGTDEEGFLTCDIRTDGAGGENGRSVPGVHGEKQQDHEAPDEDDDPGRNGDSFRSAGTHDLRHGCSEKEAARLSRREIRRKSWLFKDK
jgi:hypothetical protein